MNEGRVELMLPRESRFLGSVRQFFAALVRDLPEVRFEEQEVAEIQLVLQEACINAIRHSNGGRDDTAVRVVFLFASDRMTIEVHDGGPGFDPDEVPIPDAMGLQEGGYGIFIIKQSMDEVKTRRENGSFVFSTTRYYRPVREREEATA